MDQLIYVHVAAWFQMGLLDDLSGDEDDFTALSRDRASSKNDDDSYAPTQTSEANFFSADFEPLSQAEEGDVNFFDSDFGEPAATNGSSVGGDGGAGVDLLNINNFNSNKNPQPDVVADQLGGLDLGGEGGESAAPPPSSNVDLLVSGAEFSSPSASNATQPNAAGGSRRVPDLMGGMVDDTFDPFQQFSTSPAKGGGGAPAGAFDPFLDDQVRFSWGGRQR